LHRQIRKWKGCPGDSVPNPEDLMSAAHGSC
jgi:organic hydroperoxide reductase OsmC/OhrA